jgi:hypothetical protein
MAGEASLAESASPASSPSSVVRRQLALSGLSQPKWALVCRTKLRPNISLKQSAGLMAFRPPALKAAVGAVIAEQAVWAKDTDVLQVRSNAQTCSVRFAIPSARWTCSS